MRRIVEFIRNDSGATAIEYALIAAATGLALAAIMPTIKTNLGTTYGSVAAKLK